MRHNEMVLTAKSTVLIANFFLGNKHTLLTHIEIAETQRTKVIVNDLYDHLH